jgi:hypothetical protein
MITRRRLLQGIAAASILGFCRPLWATKRRSLFLKPGEKLKPGEYVWEPELSPEGPVTILVSLPEQMAHVYRNGIEIGVTTVSTGRKGHRTPTGVFVILQKDKHHHSSIYHSASMPNTQRLTWGGICLHAGGLPGYPSSHGCVHLPLEFSAKLFDITHLGTAVIIADEASVPDSVVHPGIVLSGDADQMIDQKLALERRKKHKTVPPAAGDHPNRVPVASVVVSGADRSSYLLKDGEIVDWKSITLAKPHQPLGTHVLVLKALEGDHPTWSAASIRHADSTASIEGTDTAILGRIKFDPDFVKQALEAMHPGMTLMITDLAADPETRSNRDFVIVTSEFVQS